MVDRRAMGALPMAIAFTGWVVTGGLFAVVALQFVTGRIDLSALLSADEVSAGGFSAERAQLLIFTLAAAAYELRAIFVAGGKGDLPDIPAAWLPVLGGSNVLYLFRKFRAAQDLRA